MWSDYLSNHIGKLLVALACMVVVAMTTGAQAWLVQPALDKIMVEGNELYIWALPAVFLGVIIVKGVASYFQSILMEMLALRVMERLQSVMFGRLIGADLAYFNATATGGLIARFISDVMAMRAALKSVAASAVRDSLTVVVLIGVMFSQNWRMASVAFIAFPLAVLFIVRIGRRLRRVFRSTQRETAELTQQLDDAFKGFREIKAYGTEDFEQQRADATFANLYRLYLKGAKARARATPVLEVLGGFIFASILGYGGYQVTHGQTTVGSFMAFFAAALMAYQPMRRILKTNTDLQRGLASAERVLEIIDMEPTITEREGASSLPVARGEVQLANVSFSYGDEAPALHDITLRAPAGRMTALVGPSGAGKSTVLSLIPRFYDVSSGAVTIDDHDIRDVTLKSLRDAVSVVSQDIVMFNDTVRANIAYGRPDATEDEIVEAAKAAAADEFIQALPQGYGTEIGERGIILSGGQRQRLSIARAMLKNAPILLLDEATSALDTESERAVQEALARLMEGRTTIVIAHRLSTVIDADIIYVFDEGRIVEQGTHAELSAGGGLYQRLSSLQFGETPPAAEAAG